MKALKSEFAKSILRDPESARALCDARIKPGFGAESATDITVTPVGRDGVRMPARTVTVMRVHKAGWNA